MAPRLAWGCALAVSMLGSATGACGNNATPSNADGGAPSEGGLAHPDGGAGSGSGSGGSSGGSTSGSSSGASGSGSGGSSDTCQTYASKAYACCQGSSSCGGVSEQTFLQYCEGFLPSCQVFYTCFLSASTCDEANDCPTLGDGGCS